MGGRATASQVIAQQLPYQDFSTGYFDQRQRDQAASRAVPHLEHLWCRTRLEQAAQSGVRPSEKFSEQDCRTPFCDRLVMTTCTPHQPGGVPT